MKVAKNAQKRVILLDYEGTLTAMHRLPELANPSRNVLAILKKLQTKENVFIYILSGRERVHLDKWFESTEVGLSAEHGCFYKHPLCLQEKIDPMMNFLSEGKTINKETKEWYRLVEQPDPAWKETILPLFNHFTERTPGSAIEEKEINLTWNYRNAESEFGSWQATELQVNLEKLLSHMALTVSNADYLLHK